MLNSSKLKQMHPAKFVQQAGACDEIAVAALRETKEILLPDTYETLKPQDKLLANGIFFEIFFEKYRYLLNAKQKNKLQGNDISVEKYKNMPKRYRGIFVPKDSENYVLHNNWLPSTIISTKSKNKNKVKSLLEHADRFIPAISPAIAEIKAKGHPIADNIDDSTFAPKHSLSAYFVNNLQMCALEEVQKTFVNICAISAMYSIENFNRHGAIDVYNEYLNELTHKNLYLNAQKSINAIKPTGLQELLNHTNSKETDGINVLIDLAQEKYAKVRQQIITDVKKRVK